MVKLPWYMIILAPSVFFVTVYSLIGGKHALDMLVALTMALAVIILFFIEESGEP